MKGSTSKIIMAAILIMVVTLAIILGLVLVLLVEFFCSFLLRRRQRSKTTINFTSTSTTQPPLQCHQSKMSIDFATASTIRPPSDRQQEEHSIAPTTLSSFYAQGVLHVPRNLLFPTISTKDHNFDLEIVHENIPYPKLIHEIPLQCSTSTTKEQFVYISNPIYDNETMALDTPFETPNSSPSCLELICTSSEEDENFRISSSNSSPSSLPLTPMKKLPVEACSISLRGARSIGTSRSDSNSNNSSSSSGSPCTSPSW